MLVLIIAETAADNPHADFGQTAPGSALDLGGQGGQRKTSAQRAERQYEGLDVVAVVGRKGKQRRKCDEQDLRGERPQLGRGRC